MDEEQIRSRIVELENEIKKLEALLPALKSSHGYFPASLWDMSNLLVSFNKPQGMRIMKRARPKFVMVENEPIDK